MTVNVALVESILRVPCNCKLDIFIFLTR